MVIAKDILGNPVMIDAYQAGIPANGRPVPDGVKMAKDYVFTEYGKR